MFMVEDYHYRSRRRQSRCYGPHKTKMILLQSENCSKIIPCYGLCRLSRKHHSKQNQVQICVAVAVITEVASSPIFTQFFNQEATCVSCLSRLDMLGKLM
uniref:Uncharacterized protein n=1 Tax=Tanacetum cinerariifolium TaxID=118510 RepID=A0A6L2JDZ9_TANCI|nr:hypothetical protein [Tanacetum cinerariifolium]